MTNVQLAKDLIQEKNVRGKALSKNQIAQLLVKRYPSNFKSVEQARNSVRLATGASGRYNRTATKTVTEWKLDIPAPEKNDYTKFVLNDERVALLMDIHFPYYDPALNVAVNYLRKWKPDAIVLNGDIIDCYHLSNWEKDPRKRSFKYELDMLKSFILQLRKLFPNTRIVYKLGNHEERYEKKILQRVPEFVDIELFTFSSVIEAKKLGIEVVDNKRTIKAGKVNIVHGHELPRGISAPVNPARGLYLKTKNNAIAGHWHQSSEHFESDINEMITGAWSVGCLCELHPHYMPINKWNHGLATLENFKTDFTVKNLKIINGKVL